MQSQYNVPPDSDVGTSPSAVAQPPPGDPPRYPRSPTHSLLRNRRHSHHTPDTSLSQRALEFFGPSYSRPDPAYSLASGRTFFNGRVLSDRPDPNVLNEVYYAGLKCNASQTAIKAAFLTVWVETHGHNLPYFVRAMTQDSFSKRLGAFQVRTDLDGGRISDKALDVGLCAEDWFATAALIEAREPEGLTRRLKPEKLARLVALEREGQYNMKETGPHEAGAGTPKGDKTPTSEDASLPDTPVTTPSSDSQPVSDPLPCYSTPDPFSQKHNIQIAEYELGIIRDAARNQPQRRHDGQSQPYSVDDLWTWSPDSVYREGDLVAHGFRAYRARRNVQRENPDRSLAWNDLQELGW